MPKEVSQDELDKDAAEQVEIIFFEEASIESMTSRRPVWACHTMLVRSSALLKREIGDKQI